VRPEEKPATRKKETCKTAVGVFLVQYDPREELRRAIQAKTS
jgi:hypothetical protein